MAPRRSASSCSRTDSCSGLESTLPAGGVRKPRRKVSARRGPPMTTSHQDDRSSSEDSEYEDLLVTPNEEVFCDGSWWEVVDTVQGKEYSCLREHLAPSAPSAGEHGDLITAERVREKRRKADDADCGDLAAGMDVSVTCRHPEWREVGSKAIYDAQITSVARAAHTSSGKCTCRFEVRLYSTDTVDPCRRFGGRPLVAGPSGVRSVSISAVHILDY